MTAFYSKMNNTSTALIKKFGGVMTLEDASAVVLDTMYCIMGTLTVENTPSTLTEQAEALVYCTTSKVVPNENHYAKIGGVLYKVIYVTNYKPDGATDLLFGLYLKR
jgi:hypothetical protein